MISYLKVDFASIQKDMQTGAKTLSNDVLHRTRRNRCGFGEGRRQRAVSTTGEGAPVTTRPLRRIRIPPFDR